MMLTGDKIVFDLDKAARAAHEIVRQESSRPTWWSEWDDTPEHERDVWRRAVLAGIAEYDPETFTVIRTELIRLWKIVGPVIRPYLSLITKEQ